MLRIDLARFWHRRLIKCLLKAILAESLYVPIQDPVRDGLMLCIGGLIKTLNTTKLCDPRCDLKW